MRIVLLGSNYWGSKFSLKNLKKQIFGKKVFEHIYGNIQLRINFEDSELCVDSENVIFVYGKVKYSKIVDF